MDNQVAQHTCTPACDGFHGPGPCPEPPKVINCSGGFTLPSLGVLFGNKEEDDG